MRAAMAERAANTERVARLWVAAKRRGVLDLPNTGATYWYEHVATGTLRGGLVDLFHGDFIVLRRLSTLSLADQDRVLARERFEVWADGGVKSLPVAAMSCKQVLALVQNGGFVPPEPPAPQLVQAKKKVVAEEPPAELRKYTPKLDREKGQIVVGQVAVPLARFLETLASNKPDKPPPLDLKGDEIAKTGCEVVGLVLWREELERLNRAAKRANLPTNELIRKAMLAYLGHLTDGE